MIIVLLTAVAYLSYAERRLVARIQSRLGPNRVGPFGLLQPLADGIKFLFKEDIVFPATSRLIYVMAPFLALVLALISIAVIPFGSEVEIFGHRTWMQITDLNIGLLLVIGVTSLGVYGIALAGWVSNSKYSLLGGLRSSAQMMSYELALGFSLIGVLILSGSLSLRQIVIAQSGTYLGFLPRWNIFPQFVGFICYFISAIAETNRLPFDLPEAETELVAGYHTEYSSMKFAMFFMAEYSNMITASCLATILFFGGWLGPLFGPAWMQMLLPTFWFVLKVAIFLFIYIWIRGTLPRFRYDQLMAFGWKFLVPLSILNILVTSFLVAWRSGG